MFATLSQGLLSGSREFGGYSSESRGAMAVVPAALESHRQKVAPIGHRASPRGSRATDGGSGWKVHSRITEIRTLLS